MRLTLLFTVFCLVIIEGAFSQPARQPITNRFVPIPYNDLRNAAIVRQQHYDANLKYSHDLINWIFELRSQNPDAQFEKELISCYNQLQKMQKEDLALLGNELMKIEYSIKESQLRFNNRKSNKQSVDNLIVSESKAASLWYKYGSNSLDEKNYPEAIKGFNYAIEEDPSLWEAYFKRGFCYQSINNHSAAIQDYTKVLMLNPNNSVAFFNRGLAKFNLNDISGACIDWRNSAQNGYSKANEFLNQYCK